MKKQKELFDYLADEIKRENKLKKLKQKEQVTLKRIDTEGSGLILEKVMVGAIKEIPTIAQLENLRYLINTEIKLRKIMKRIKEK